MREKLDQVICLDDKKKQWSAAPILADPDRKKRDRDPDVRQEPAFAVDVANGDLLTWEMEGYHGIYVVSWNM